MNTENGFAVRLHRHPLAHEQFELLPLEARHVSLVLDAVIDRLDGVVRQVRGLRECRGNGNAILAKHRLNDGQ